VFEVQQSKGIHGTGACRFKPGSSGFSLLEVLVASTVFSVGLAGFAAFLLTSIIGSAQARREGIVATAAASLAEQIRLNSTAINRYLAPPETLSAICTGEYQCTPEQQADYDFKLWQLDLADSVKDATGLVCRDSTPADGDEGNELCDGTGSPVIKIFWYGQGNPESNESNQDRFTL